VYGRQKHLSVATVGTVMNQLDGLISSTATALSAAEGRATEVVLAIDQQAPAGARVQPSDDDNTKQFDLFLKYQNGFLLLQEEE
jgi:hypothetical protein